MFEFRIKILYHICVCSLTLYFASYSQLYLKVTLNQRFIQFSNLNYFIADLIRAPLTVLVFERAGPGSCLHQYKIKLSHDVNSFLLLISLISCLQLFLPNFNGAINHIFFILHCNFFFEKIFLLTWSGSNWTVHKSASFLVALKSRPDIWYDIACKFIRYSTSSIIQKGHKLQFYQLLPNTFHWHAKELDPTLLEPFLILYLATETYNLQKCCYLPLSPAEPNTVLYAPDQSETFGM